MEGALSRGGQCRSNLDGRRREEESARRNKPFAIPWWTMILNDGSELRFLCKEPGRQALYGSTEAVYMMGTLVLTLTGGVFN
jgi:hypothetical protein